MFIHHSSLDVRERPDASGSQDTVDTKGAALILGVSESWLHKLRAFNPDESPRFLKCGRRVFYRLGDLHAWQEVRARGGRPTA